METKAYFYKDKPIFGLDIGISSLKVMQLGWHGKKRIVQGYGVIGFDAKSIIDGVITNPETMAQAAHTLFTKNIIGNISTHRAAFAAPASRTFTRAIRLPILETKDISEAVRLEAEQYIPVPIDDLYLDYQIISKNEKELELLAVAIPRKIVDSIRVFSKLLGLDLVAVESSIEAASRLFVQAEQSSIPTILVDFGSISADVTIYDKTLIVTGTVFGGGDSFTELIAKKLNVSNSEAHIIKTKYGMGVSKKQKEITDSLTPLLEQIVKEIKRMIRYYEERSDTDRKIGQIVTMGGGANMPGLSDFMTNNLRLPVRMCDPWQHLKLDHLQPPNFIEKSLYVTVAGLALMAPAEIYK